jgi:hypothetical protein
VKTKIVMTATFTKTPGAPTVYRWRDGTVATTMNWGRGIPHDMGHWFMEAQVDLPYGFWSLAGQQAPFDSFTLVHGRWPKGRQEFLDRVRRKHREAMLHAEAHGGLWLARPDLNVHAEWPDIRRKLAKAYAFTESPLAHLGPDDVERLRPFALRATQVWNDLPDGASVEVRWAGANDLELVG